MNQTRYTPTRSKTIAIAGGIVLVSVIAAIWILWVVEVPGIVRGQIARAFERGGLPGTAVHIVKVTPTHAIITGLSIAGDLGLRVDSIHIGYSPLSLMRGRVGRIGLYRMSVSVRIDSAGIAGGLLSRIHRGATEVGLPFDLLDIHDATVRLLFEKREVPISVSARISPQGSHTIDIQARVAYRAAAVSLRASVDTRTIEYSGDVTVDGLDMTLLETFTPMIPAAFRFPANGYADAAGKVVGRKGAWTVEGRLTGCRFWIEPVIGNSPFRLGVDTLVVRLSTVQGDSSTAILRGEAEGMTVTSRGVFDLRTRQGFCTVDAHGPAEGLARMIGERYPSTGSLHASGVIDVTGSITVRDSLLTCALNAAGKQLRIEALVGNNRIHLEHPEFHATAEALIGKGISWRSGSAVVRNARLDDIVVGLSLDIDSLRLPFRAAPAPPENGAFSFRSMLLDNRPCGTLAGRLTIAKQHVDIQGSGNLLPEAPMEVRGWYQWVDSQPASGELSAQVAPFRLRTLDRVYKWFPAIAHDTVQGTLGLQLRIGITGARVSERLRVDVHDGSWGKESSKTGVRGVCGSLLLDSLSRPRTAAPGKFTIDTAFAASVRVTSGTAAISFGSDSLVRFDSVICAWAGGTLGSSLVIVDPAAKQVRLDLQARGLGLQNILDFVRYDGVRGTGTLSGHLPFTFHWGDRTHLSFGEGFLEAQPHSGMLNFTKETARKLLGMTHEINSKHATMEQTVSLMMLNALQDMEYTSLKAIFGKEPQGGWAAWLQIQGFGPRGSKAGRIPIGGLNINIHDLNQLLNNAIFQRLGSGQVKFQ